MFSTVAVGLDGSPTAGHAVDTAAELARRFDATLVLISAYRPRDGAPHAHEEEGDWAANPAARQAELIARTERRLVDSGLRVTSREAAGNPGEVLVRVAGECGADVLVVGSKGMEHRVLGSVPNHVTHKADCSVLVVKTT
jgi:nucleotide-binding universal stress UspA family protein